MLHYVTQQLVSNYVLAWLVQSQSLRCDQKYHYSVVNYTENPIISTHYCGLPHKNSGWM